MKPILSVDDGVVHPIGKVRGRQKALAEFARVFDGGDRGSARAAGRDRPRGRAGVDRRAHRHSRSKARPQAEIELVENLGAVVGTHAGPGSVGFFWFQDE